MMSLFSVVDDPVQAVEEINSNLRLIKNWATDWKTAFTSDPLKQATDVLFYNKRHNVFQPGIYFNRVKVKHSPSQKHLGMVL